MNIIIIAIMVAVIAGIFHGEEYLAKRRAMKEYEDITRMYYPTEC